MVTTKSRGFRMTDVLPSIIARGRTGIDQATSPAAPRDDLITQCQAPHFRTAVVARQELAPTPPFGLDQSMRRYLGFDRVRRPHPLSNFDSGVSRGPGHCLSRHSNRIDGWDGPKAGSPRHWAKAQRGHCGRIGRGLIAECGHIHTVTPEADVPGVIPPRDGSFPDRDLGSVPQEHRNPLQWRAHRQHLAPFVLLPRPGVGPSRTQRQVHLAGGGLLDRHDCCQRAVDDTAVRGAEADVGLAGSSAPGRSSRMRWRSWPIDRSLPALPLGARPTHGRPRHVRTPARAGRPSLWLSGGRRRSPPSRWP